MSTKMVSHSALQSRCFNKHNQHWEWSKTLIQCPNY